MRELAEETGMTAERMVPLGAIDPLPGITAARVHLMWATGLTPGEVHREGTEVAMTSRWMPIGEAVEAVTAGEITEAGSVVALLRVALIRGVGRDAT